MRQVINRPGARSIVKVALIVIMLLLFLIPLNMIQSLVYERESRAWEASHEVISGAGGALSFVGPLFAVPYEYVEKDQRGILREKRGEVYVLPDFFRADGTLTASYRTRGIYKVPVYQSHLVFEGSVSFPGIEAFPPEAEVLYDKVRMIVGIGDMRGIREASDFNWNGTAISFVPDVGNPSIGAGISAGNLNLAQNGSSTDFSWTMEIGGGGSVSLAPLGRDSELHLSGDWPSPSFTGARLPDERSWDEKGFEARWRIPEVSRPIKSHWNAGNEAVGSLGSHALTVELLEPVGTYSRSHRSVKYGALFLLIPFVVFFLFETIAGTRVHPVQYLLAGAANIIFYLLLLAISEHWGFDSAYLIASSAVTILLGFYTWGITGKRLSGLVMPLVMAAAYLWLWVSLQSEDYALLIGSIGLFGIVAMVMFFTRKVTWYRNQELDGVDLGPERENGQTSQLDVLPTEGDSQDGDSEEKGAEDMSDGEFPAE